MEIFGLQMMKIQVKFADFLFFSFILFFLLLASGCATTKISSRAPAPKSWDEHKAKLQAVQSWQMRGRVSIKSLDKAFDSLSANVFWRQQDQFYDISLFGPVGLGAIKLLGQPGQTVLTDNQNHQYKAESPESLMQQQLGWSLPVSQLYYWVRGLPAPERIDQLYISPDNRLESLEQDGWIITYQTYQYINHIWFPRKIVLKAQNIKVTLLVSNLLVLG